MSNYIIEYTDCYPSDSFQGRKAHMVCVKWFQIWVLVRDRRKAMEHLCMAAILGSRVMGGHGWPCSGIINALCGHFLTIGITKHHSSLEDKPPVCTYLSKSSHLLTEQIKFCLRGRAAR